MDRKKFKMEIVEILRDAAVDEVRKQNFSHEPTKVSAIAEEFASEAAERLLNKHTPKPGEITESKAQDALALPVARTRESVRKAVQWCIADLKPNQTISADRIRKIVHDRMSRLPSNEVMILEGFFPFKNDYEV